MDLRPVDGLDCQLLYEWRLEGEEASWYKGKPVDWAEHVKWFMRRLRRPRLCKIWIAVDEVPVGYARLDSNGELSFYVAQEFRGQGYGEEIVRKVCRLAKHHRIKASVDDEDTDTISALQSVGFVEYPDVRFFLWRP